MKPVLTLLFFKVAIAQVVLYQPQNTVSVGIGATAVILCTSSDSLDEGTGITWHVRRRTDKAHLRVKSCLADNDQHKYICKSENHQARLEIYNVSLEDSGVYYCMFSYTAVLRVLGNGTTLIVEDTSAIHSIHLLASAMASDHKVPTQLVCIVSGALHTVHVTWNISGRHLKGKLTSVEELGGIWTTQNLLSLPQNTWNYGDHATCEVWFSFSPIQTHWSVQKKGHVCITEYPSYVRYVLILMALLMFIFTVHLSWTYK
ncbi:uncharacterized protein LOC120920664 [Rana temporaria]|uniref:uncharacterized protein LOC120920664 n=1 Tax=Rana temporaria TaxID=8407 RepID=UPI001AAD8048|nr:uncharacterized protein LOC120920664 [Rana temporaria]